MQVYSPDSPSDESLSSPILEADYIFPGPFASFLEEDLSGLSSLEAVPTPSTDSAPDLPSMNQEDIFNIPAEPLQIIEVSEPGEREETEGTETSVPSMGSFLSRSRQADQERRRFSASELISRLQLSQRKNSFTLKLGKSLSARVASRDRQNSSSFNPNSDCELPTSWYLFLGHTVKNNPVDVKRSQQLQLLASSWSTAFARTKMIP